MCVYGVNKDDQRHHQFLHDRRSRKTVVEMTVSVVAVGKFVSDCCQFQSSL